MLSFLYSTWAGMRLPSGAPTDRPCIGRERSCVQACRVLTPSACRAPPACVLELEVTEGALMRHVDEVARVLRALREPGVKIAIDDFGTGYSSLSYLQRFSIDRLKIDRAFVQEIGSDAEYEALTQAVIAMAGALKFDVIAEGVETREQQQFLVRHGRVNGQGSLFGEPVSASRIAGLATLHAPIV